MSAESFKVGDRVGIIGVDHPHRGESGTITRPATGGPRSVGLDWEVKLDGASRLADGCFVAEDEIRHDRRGAR